jgi:excisionase family DNA binding protein
MPASVTTSEAARRLGTTKPTVRVLLEKGQLSGTRLPRGSRFNWRIDEDSLERFLAECGRYDSRRAARTSRLGKIEVELAFLRQAVRGQGAEAGVLSNHQGPVDEIQRERDDLRAQVVSLEEALARAHAVAELQRDADAERAAVVEHLLAAGAANERADALRRKALTELEEALAGFARPGLQVRCARAR